MEGVAISFDSFQVAADALHCFLVLAGLWALGESYTLVDGKLYYLGMRI
jgi:hypothetical protein